MLWEHIYSVSIVCSENTLFSPFPKQVQIKEEIEFTYSLFDEPTQVFSFFVSVKGSILIYLEKQNFILLSSLKLI